MLAQGAFDGGFFPVAGCQAKLQMDARHAHEIDVCPHATYGLGGDSADCHHGMLEQSAANQFNFDTRMVGQCYSNARAVRYDRCLEVSGQMPDQLDGRRAPIKHDELAWLYHAGGGTTDRGFPFCRHLLAGGKARRSR